MVFSYTDAVLPTPYLQDIFGLGRDLQEEHVENLTDDQKLQLQKLQESAVSVGEELRSESKEASSQNHQKP